MIESASFTNVNGLVVVLNDDNIPFKELVTEVSTRMTEREKSQQHGIYPSNTYLGKRLFHCQGDLFAPDSSIYIQRRLALIGALLPRPHLGYKQAGLLELLFTGMSETLTSECTIDGYPELPMVGGHAARSAYQINFKSFDPRLYGDTQTVEIDFAQSDNLGGLSFPFTFDFDFSGGSSGINDVLLTNAGNIETYPVVVLHGLCVDPQLILSRADGSTFYLKLLGLTIPDGYTVTVDFLRRTVIRSDGVNLYNFAIDSDWWAIEPAPLTNTVRFTVTSANTPARAVISWRNAYMI